MGLMEDADAISFGDASKSRSPGQTRLDYAIDRYAREFITADIKSGLPNQHRGVTRPRNRRNDRWDFTVLVHPDLTKQSEEREVWGTFTVNSVSWRWQVQPTESEDDWAPYSAELFDTYIRRLFAERLAAFHPYTGSAFDPTEVDRAVRKVALWGSVTIVAAVLLFVESVFFSTDEMLFLLGGWFNFILLVTFFSLTTGAYNLWEWRGNLKVARNRPELQ